MVVNTENFMDYETAISQKMFLARSSKDAWCSRLYLLLNVSLGRKMNLMHLVPLMGFLSGTVVKNLPVDEGDARNAVQSPCQEDPLE